MLFRLAAEGVLLIHFAFILFALFGALLALRWRKMLLVHPVAAVWGFFIEITGRICPLTYLENMLRGRAGQSGYPGSFLEHYLMPIIYPGGLSQGVQYALAGVVAAVNCAIYSWIFFRQRRLLDRADAGHRGER